MSADEIRTRRALLGAGLGSLVAVVASGLGRPGRTSAANGDRLKIGSAANVATNPTNLNAGSADDYGFGVDHAGANGFAIWGASTNFTGTGVKGSNSNSGGTGVLGEAHVGVSGLATNSGGDGVRGAQFHDNGLGGGAGVHGFGGLAVGVRGEATSGVGVSAESGPSGTALDVKGKATFQRSGRVTITAGHGSTQISVAGVNGQSWVVATLQKNVTGLFVRAAVPTAGKVTIHLNKVTDQNVPVGFFVLN